MAGCAALQILPTAQGFTFTDLVADPVEQTIGFSLVRRQNQVDMATWMASGGAQLSTDAGQATMTGMIFGLYDHGGGDSASLDLSAFGNRTQVLVTATVGDMTASCIVVRLDRSTSERGATRNVWRGDWALGVDYVEGDCVHHGGSSWITILAHTSDAFNAPPSLPVTENLNWRIMARQGTRGSRTFYVSGQTAWSDAAANAEVALVGGAVLNDVVTEYGPNFAETRFWNGSAWVPLTVALDGNLLVSGTVGAAALAANTITAESGVIANAAIGSAHIQDASINNAHIVNCSADRLTAGTIAVNEHIRSTGYVAGAAGWNINGNGSVEFNDIFARGNIRATSFDAITLNPGEHIKQGQTAFDTGNGLWLGSDGGVAKFSMRSANGQYLRWDGVSLQAKGGFVGLDYEAGTVPVASSHTERAITNGGGSLVKIKEIVVVRNGTVTVSVDLRACAADTQASNVDLDTANPASGFSYVRLCKNGVTQVTWMAGNYPQYIGTVYSTRAANLSVVPGDLVQIYVSAFGVRPNSRDNIYVKNFKVMSNVPTTETVTMD